MKIERTDNGNIYSFRQSWIGNWLRCPEQARLAMAGDVERFESDALAIGTSVHSAIEARLRGSDFEVSLRAAVDKFNALSDTPGFEWQKVKTYATAYDHIAACFQAWEEDVYPCLGEPITIERHFEVPLDVRGVDQLWLHGTWDLEDHSGLWDWKTGGKYYEEWEAKRFYIQPTVYLKAHQILNDLAEPVPFNYAVLLKGPRPSPAQVFSVERTEADFAFLVERLWNIVDTYKAHLPRWPMLDQGWHCSPKFCPSWLQCKGAHAPTQRKEAT